MFSAIRKHITPAMVLAFVALIFAITGGAFAATGASSGLGPGSHSAPTATATAAKAKPKAKPGPRGPAGPKGATGAAGATGPAGPTGPGGATGPAGSQGPAGANGQGVTSAAASASECKAGGTTFTSASGPSKACNGEKGAPGATGPQGVIHPGETLPSGASVTGTWSTIYTATAAGQPMTSAISFAIPLKTSPETHYIKEGETPPNGCSDTSGKLEAASGNLCVFAETEEHATEYLLDGLFPTHYFLFASVAGSAVGIQATEAGVVEAGGTWVVTGD